MNGTSNTFDATGGAGPCQVPGLEMLGDWEWHEVTQVFGLLPPVNRTGAGPAGAGHHRMVCRGGPDLSAGTDQILSRGGNAASPSRSSIKNITAPPCRDCLGGAAISA